MGSWACKPGLQPIIKSSGFTLSVEKSYRQHLPLCLICIWTIKGNLRCFMMDSPWIPNIISFHYDTRVGFHKTVFTKKKTRWLGQTRAQVKWCIIKATQERTVWSDLTTFILNGKTLHVWNFESCSCKFSSLPAVTCKILLYIHIFTLIMKN